MFSKKNYLMTVPAIILFSLFVFYPLVRGFYYSLTDWNGFSQHYNFVGFLNYLNIFRDPKILRAFRNTFIISISDVILQVVIGLTYALLLNSNFRLKNIVRVIIYMPIMISTLIMGYIWYFILQYSGALNDILLRFQAEPVDWLLYPRFSIFFIIVIIVLQFVGQSMIIFLAGLQVIPKEMYQAADIDGANKRQILYHITLPSLRPALITVVTLKLIGSLQIFDLIIALTDGGPGGLSHSVSTMISHLYYGSERAGYATTLGIILFILIFTLTILTNRIIDRERR